MAESIQYDILLLGPELLRSDAAAFSFAHTVEQNGFSVATRLPRHSGHDERPYALRLQTSRTEELHDDLRSALMDEAERLRMDAFFLRTPVTRPRLFAFDMDSTLIQAEIIDELAALAGVKERVSAITERAMRGEIDFREALAERLALLRGIPQEKIMTLLHRVRISDGLPELIRGLKIFGIKTAILSGGFGFFARHLQRTLGFDHVVCNELEIEDGALTGKLASEIVDATRKVAALKEYAASEGVPLAQAVVVGDGANDLPMLQAAGIGVAYRAKPKVKAAARYRLNFAGLDSLLQLV